MSEQLAQKPVESLPRGAPEDIANIVETGAEFTDQHEQKMEGYGQQLAEAVKADPELSDLMDTLMAGQRRLNQEKVPGPNLIDKVQKVSDAVADNATFKGLLEGLTNQFQSDLQTGEMPRVWTETTQDNKGKDVFHVVTATDTTRIAVKDIMGGDPSGERLDAIPLRVKGGDRGSRIVMVNDVEVAKAAEVMSGYVEQQQNEGALEPQLGSVAMGSQTEHIEQ